jgi:hypothetical protein
MHEGVPPVYHRGIFIGSQLTSGQLQELISESD